MSGKCHWLQSEERVGREPVSVGPASPVPVQVIMAWTSIMLAGKGVCEDRISWGRVGAGRQAKKRLKERKESRKPPPGFWFVQ